MCQRYLVSYVGVLVCWGIALHDLRSRPHLDRILPAAAWYFRFSVFGFSALRAEKPNTKNNQVPRFPSGVEGLPKAKTADRVYQFRLAHETARHNGWPIKQAICAKIRNTIRNSLDVPADVIDYSDDTK